MTEDGFPRNDLDVPQSMLFIFFLDLSHANGT